MDLQTIVDELELTVLTETTGLDDVVPAGGYASDLLSCVMAKAIRQGIWVTLQAHNNVVAVAALLELAAVILTEGVQPEPATLAKAKEEGVVLLATPRTTFEVVGRLWELGVCMPITA
jgi:imidazolonepropionase-like amidohydrolase